MKMLAAREGPWIVAHRGASAHAPENTLAAVRLAWELDADAVEVDLRLTRDGHVVVCHDEATARTSNTDLVVADATLAELRALDAGAWRGSAWEGERIPTASEVLATCPRGRHLVLELKASAELLSPLAGDLAAAVATGGPHASHIVFLAFDLEVARLAKQRFADSHVLWLGDLADAPNDEEARRAVRRMIATARAAGLDGLDLGVHRVLESGAIDDIHAAGLRAFVWTVNDPSEAQRLMRAGIDAITTDQPAALLAARQAWCASRA
jgi:glycerophosphoryl diester phosphodiesterase